MADWPGKPQTPFSGDLRAHIALSVATVLLPFILVFAPRGMSLLFCILSLLLFLSPNVRHSLRYVLTSPFVQSAMPLAVLGFLSAIWALEPLYSLGVAFRTAALIVSVPVFFSAVSSLAQTQRQSLVFLFGSAVMVMAALLLLGVGKDGLLLRLLHDGPRLGDDDKVRFLPGVAALATLAWPAGIAIWRRFGFLYVLIFLGLCLGVFLRNLSYAPLVAIVVSAAAFLLVYTLRKVAIWLIIAFWLAAGAAFPFVVRQAFDEYPDFTQIIESTPWEIHHRLWIWEFSSKKFLEKPLLGWGMDSSRSIPEGRENLQVQSVEGAEKLPLHPHNVFMQIWLEFGFAGYSLLALLLSAIGRQLSRIEGRSEQATATAMFVTVLFLESVSYGVWQSKWLALIVLAATYYKLAVAAPRNS